METTLTSGILSSLPGRYAKALFDLARDHDKVETVGSGLSSVRKLILTSPVLKQALSNPTLNRQQQAAAIKDISLSLKGPEILGSFMEKLVEAGRMPHLDQIEKIYKSLVSEEKGEERIEVISSHPLTTSQATLLKDKLKKVFPRTLTLTFVNDSSVLGGIMVRVGSRVIDATLVTQLSQLATVMKGNA
jgi:F-type H+-transporting ATPase subunit delta